VVLSQGAALSSDDVHENRSSGPRVVPTPSHPLSLQLPHAAKAEISQSPITELHGQLFRGRDGELLAFVHVAPVLLSSFFSSLYSRSLSPRQGLLGSRQLA
jgi:hypothetical protein